MSGPACQMPGPVIAPDALFADFGVISAPLVLTKEDAHQIILDPDGGSPDIELNTSPTDGESYAISNTSTGTATIKGKAGTSVATVEASRAVFLQYDSAAGEYLAWGKITLV